MPESEEATRRIGAQNVIAICAVVVALVGVWAGLANADKAPCPSVAGFCSSPGQDQEAFVASYFAELRRGDFTGAWQKLGEGYRRRNGESFDTYSAYWQSVESVQLVTVNSLSAGTTDKRVRVQWRIVYKDRAIESEVVHAVLTLVQSNGGSLVIDGSCDLRTDDNCDTSSDRPPKTAGGWRTELGGPSWVAYQSSSSCGSPGRLGLYFWDSSQPTYPGSSSSSALKTTAA